MNFRCISLLSAKVSCFVRLLDCSDTNITVVCWLQFKKKKTIERDELPYHLLAFCKVCCFVRLLDCSYTNIYMVVCNLTHKKTFFLNKRDELSQRLFAFCKVCCPVRLLVCSYKNIYMVVCCLQFFCTINFYYYWCDLLLQNEVQGAPAQSTHKGVN